MDKLIIFKGEIKMLNFEKYKDEILEISKSGYFGVNKQNNNVCTCSKLHCDNCKFSYINFKFDYRSCIENKFKWLYEEYKDPIKLTHDEYIILKNIDKKYKWIARDKDNNLCFFESKPHKLNSFWNNGEYIQCIIVFNHLFQFIKWEDEEPYNIQELLENCEVIEDD